MQVVSEHVDHVDGIRPGKPVRVSGKQHCQHDKQYSLTRTGFRQYAAVLDADQSG